MECPGHKKRGTEPGPGAAGTRDNEEGGRTVLMSQNIDSTLLFCWDLAFIHRENVADYSLLVLHLNLYLLTSLKL